MLILAIETSADETAAAITDGRRVLSNVIYSQILLHRRWGGIYPTLAKRAHEEKIGAVIAEAIRKFELLNPKFETNSKSKIQKNKNNLTMEQFNNETIKYFDYIAVTYGPGLAVALEVGIRKAKELAKKYNKKLVAVNHLEGHIYSAFVQNSKGKPERDFRFPYLALIISGGHTEIVLWKGHLKYEILGETRDDAAGEALDKAAKMLGLGYPGGPVIERLAKQVDNKDFYKFPRPMINSKNLDFSFSGLKTSFYYFLTRHSGLSRIDSGVTSVPQNDKLKLRQLASSFQNAIYDTIVAKINSAISQTGINRLIVGGGVIANLHLRKLLKDLLEKQGGAVYFPQYMYLTGDNAAMIGVAAHYKAEKGMFVKNFNIDRVPRLQLS